MIERLRAEQLAAVAYLAEHPGDREGILWLSDYLLEEILIEAQHAGK